MPTFSSRVTGTCALYTQKGNSEEFPFLLPLLKQKHISISATIISHRRCADGGCFATVTLADNLLTVLIETHQIHRF